MSKSAVPPILEDSVLSIGAFRSTNQSSGDEDTTMPIMDLDYFQPTKKGNMMKIDINSEILGGNNRVFHPKSSCDGLTTPISSKMGSKNNVESPILCPMIDCETSDPISTGNNEEALTTPGSGGSSVSCTSSDKFAKLQNLEALYQQGFLLEAEYKDRKQQLIDEITGTSLSVSDTSVSNVSKVPRSLNKNRTPSSIVVPRPPPDFANIPHEHAIKHTFDLSTRTWHTEDVLIRLDDTPFARGGLRLVYHLQEEGVDEYETCDNNQMLLHTFTPATVRVDENEELHFDEECTTKQNEVEIGDSSPRVQRRRSYVAKIAIDPAEDLSTYFRDVEMQAHCAQYAQLFNTYKPPRRVEFCKAWILELVERENQPLCAVERFVAGDYRKHNNNYGYVSEEERSTPQAFSHFTYEASAHTMLVVDIQGVSDMYTDPQIHTLNGMDFGKGNLGKRGFARFLQTHRCNKICQYLKLPPVNPKYTSDGTIPNLPYMPETKIDKGAFRESHYFEATPGLQKYLNHSGKLRRNKSKGPRNSESEAYEEWWTTSDDVDASMCQCVIS